MNRKENLFVSNEIDYIRVFNTLYISLISIAIR